MSSTPTPWRIGNLASYDGYTGKPFRNIWAGGREDEMGDTVDAICVARCIDNGNCDQDASLIVEAVNEYESLKTEVERLRALCRSAINHLESLSDRAADGGLPYLGVSLQELANRLDTALDADAKSLEETT